MSAGLRLERIAGRLGAVQYEVSAAARGEEGAMLLCVGEFDPFLMLMDRLFPEMVSQSTKLTRAWHWAFDALTGEFIGCAGSTGGYRKNPWRVSRDKLEMAKVVLAAQALGNGGNGRRERCQATNAASMGIMLRIGMGGHVGKTGGVHAVARTRPMTAEDWAERRELERLYLAAKPAYATYRQRVTRRLEQVKKPLAALPTVNWFEGEEAQCVVVRAVEEAQ